MEEKLCVREYHVYDDWQAGIPAYFRTHSGAVGLVQSTLLLAASFVTSCTRQFASAMDDEGRVKESWPQ